MSKLCIPCFARRLRAADDIHLAALSETKCVPQLDSRGYGPFVSGELYSVEIVWDWATSQCAQGRPSAIDDLRHLVTVPAPVLPHRDARSHPGSGASRTRGAGAVSSGRQSLTMKRGVKDIPWFDQNSALTLKELQRTKRKSRTLG
jgi:hypothetical protein